MYSHTVDKKKKVIKFLMQNYLDQYILDRLAVRILVSRGEVHPNLRKHEWPHVYMGCSPFEFENYRCVDEERQIWVHNLWKAAGGTLPRYHTEPPLRWFISRDIKKRSYCIAEPDIWFWDDGMDVVDIRGISASSYLVRIIPKDIINRMVDRYGYILYDFTIKLCDKSVAAGEFLQEQWQRIHNLRKLQWLKVTLEKRPNELHFIELLKQVQHGLIISRQNSTLTWKGRLLLKMFR
jgi:hypothetical protein